MLMEYRSGRIASPVFRRRMLSASKLSPIGTEPAAPPSKEVRHGTAEEGAGAVAADLAALGCAVGDGGARAGGTRPARREGARPNRPAARDGRGDLSDADRVPVESAAAGVSRRQH